MHRAAPAALFALMLGMMLAGISARAQQYPEGMAAPAGDLSWLRHPVRHPAESKVRSCRGSRTTR